MEDGAKNAQLRLFDDHLKTVREAAAEVQRKQQDRRSSVVPGAGSEQYAVGDSVLKRRDFNQFKLSWPISSVVNLQGGCDRQRSLECTVCFSYG
jgi:hypothetical protein